MEEAAVETRFRGPGAGGTVPVEAMEPGKPRPVLYTRREELEELHPAWRELWSRAGRGNPFTHPAWVLAWLDHLGQGVQPRVSAVWSQDRLAALAPLGRTRFGPWRRLAALGWPEADYPDLLAEDGRGEVLEALVGCLVSDSWHFLELQDLPQGSPHLEPLQALLDKYGIKPILSRGSICPRLAISGSWEDYWAAKKPKTRSTLGRKERRLAREWGPLELEVLEGEEALQGGLAETAGVHAARWAREHTRTLYSKPRGRRFFQAALAGLAQEGLVRLYSLRAGTRVAAFCLSFLSQGVHYYYIPGFDPSFSKDSPGHLLLRRIIQEAHQEGMAVFDFMKGEEEYKYRWAGDETWTRRLLAARPEPFARLGMETRRGFFRLRDRARQSPAVRRLFFKTMSFKTVLGREEPD